MPALPSSSYQSINNEHIFGTWLIPVIIFCSLLCVAIIAFLWLFFVYGCWCWGQSEEIHTSRSGLRKEFSAGVLQNRRIVLLPQPDYSVAHTPRANRHQRVYRDFSPQQYGDQDSLYQEDYEPPLYGVEVRPPPPQQIHEQLSHAYLNQQAPPLVQYQQFYEQPPAYKTPPQQRNYLSPSPSPPSPTPLRRPVRSVVSHHPSNSDGSLHLAYDDSMPTLFSQQSSSYYPLDSTLGSIRHGLSFSSEGFSPDIPLLKFTPPSANDLASLALEPVCSLDDLFLATNVDMCRRVPQSRSFPDVPIPKRKSRANRAIAIIGANVVVEGVSNVMNQDLALKKALGDVQNREVKKRRRQAGGVYMRGEENEGVVTTPTKDHSDDFSRKSMVVKVWSPSTCDLWKFWVSRNESLDEFTKRVKEKLGVEVGLSVMEIPMTEQDWRCLPRGSRISACSI